MKTIQEMIKRHEHREDYVGSHVIYSEKVEEICEEYAEEYAKAYAQWLVDKGYVDHMDVGDCSIEAFKESLKK